MGGEKEEQDTKQGLAMYMYKRGYVWVHISAYVHIICKKEIVVSLYYSFCDHHLFIDYYK